MIGYFPGELREKYREGRVIPFLGAGVSMSVRWTANGIERHGPSWKELVNESARILGFEDPELLRVRGTDLQILEYFRIKHGEMARLTNWLYAEMLPPDDQLKASPIHAELAKLTGCRVIYTTNYDDFIERSMELNGRKCRTVAVEADLGLRNSGEDCEIVKFHGDWNHPNHMVLSESHYEQRLRLDTAMDHRFRADVLGRTLLFLGYSFRDWNVSYLFRLVNDYFKLLPNSVSGKRAYILVPDPSDFERQLFLARNMEVIPISGESQTQDIVELLKHLWS